MSERHEVRTDLPRPPAHPEDAEWEAGREGLGLQREIEASGTDGRGTGGVGEDLGGYGALPEEDEDVL